MNINKNNHNLNKYTVSSNLRETRLPEISRFIHKRDGSALFTIHEKLQGALNKFSLQKSNMDKREAIIN